MNNDYKNEKRIATIGLFILCIYYVIFYYKNLTNFNWSFEALISPYLTPIPGILIIAAIIPFVPFIAVLRLKQNTPETSNFAKATKHFFIVVMFCFLAFFTIGLVNGLLQLV